MSHKIQVTIDNQLHQFIQQQAKHMGLSVSSYARLALMRLLPKSHGSQLDQALDDLKHNRVDSIDIETFNKQIDNL